MRIKKLIWLIVIFSMLISNSSLILAKDPIKPDDIGNVELDIGGRMASLYIETLYNNIELKYGDDGERIVEGIRSGSMTKKDFDAAVSMIEESTSQGSSYTLTFDSPKGTVTAEPDVMRVANKKVRVLTVETDLEGWGGKSKAYVVKDEDKLPVDVKKMLAEEEEDIYQSRLIDESKAVKTYLELENTDVYITKTGENEYTAWQKNPDGTYKRVETYKTEDGEIVGGTSYWIYEEGNPMEDYEILNRNFDLIESEKLKISYNLAPSYGQENIQIASVEDSQSYLFDATGSSDQLCLLG